MYRTQSEYDKAKLIERELTQFRVALEVMEGYPNILAEYKEKTSGL